MSRHALLAALLLLPPASCGTSTPPDTDGIAVGDSRAELVAGNGRFLAGTMRSQTWATERVVRTGTYGQSPQVGVLSCADSRVPVEVVFDQGVGELFVVRLAGNFLTVEGVGTFEYGVAELGVHAILVLGHTKCGAVMATLAGKPLPGSIPSLVEGITPSLAEVASAGGKGPSLDAAIEANVRHQMAEILARSEILRAAKEEGRLEILGAIYDVQTGRVRFLD